MKVALRGCHGRPQDVRGAVLDWAARVADRQHRPIQLNHSATGRHHADDDRMGRAPSSARRRGDWVPCILISILVVHSPRAVVWYQGPFVFLLPWDTVRRLCLRTSSLVHLSRTRDEMMELRIRLRRQRPLRQEVLRLAHRVLEVMGPATRLAWRRLVLILKLTRPKAKSRYIAGASFHRRCGQDNRPYLIHPQAAGMEGRDDRRRHLLDEVRADGRTLRHQPEAGLFVLCGYPGRGNHYFRTPRPERPLTTPLVWRKFSLPPFF